MAEMNDIVRLAVDAYKGSVEKYSVQQSEDTVRQALIEANNGKTCLDYRDIRDGKCPQLFSLVETILSNTVQDGLSADMAFNALVDYRNVAEGDSPLFEAEDNTLFVVSDTANGTQGVRRQRLFDAPQTRIPTTVKMVRVYEELSRVLSGAVDMNKMIAKVSTSFEQKLLNDIYSAWVGATAAQLGGAAFFPTAGSYNEDALLDLIAHVEASAGGKTATITGTKKALRNLKESIVSDSAKDEIHSLGYYGKFYGTPCVAVPQRHKVGTTEFVLDDNMITVVAGDQKPIKVVREGNPLMIMGDPTRNADLTQEYLYAEKWGVGIVLAGSNAGVGRYEIA